MDPLGHQQVSDLEKVEQQLTELWRLASTEDRPVVRACAMNLVIACADGDDDVLDATRVVAGISESEPGRALVVARPSGPGPDLDVYASAHCHLGAGGTQICSEQVTLEIRGAGEALVPQTVLQLLTEDMPVITWWRRPRLLRDPLFRPLCELSNRVIVDSSSFDLPAEGLRSLKTISEEPSGTLHAFDIGWLLQEPWREALASFFDDPARRPGLENLESVRIVAGGPSTDSGRTTAASYLAGWLSSRLGWTRGEDGNWARPDGAPIRIELQHDAKLSAGQVRSVRLTAGENCPVRAFVARRLEPGSDVVELTVDGNRLSAQKIRLPDRDVTALLCGILQRGTREAAFEEALRDAARMD